MQIEEIISKVKDLREEHNREIQQEILGDLIKFRELLMEDINKVPAGEGTVEKKAAEKMEYRIHHLQKSLLEFLEKSEKEKKQLILENEKLKYQVSHLKQHIKIK